MTTENKHLNEILKNAGVSKTIYSLVLPETEQMLDIIIDGGERRHIIEQALSHHFLTQAQQGGDPLDITNLAKKLDSTLAQYRDPFHNMYREAWTQKQDPMHEEFFTTWKAWAAPIVELDETQFPHMYPTVGASEGLRVAINEYGNRARTEGFTPLIHVFDGEYEGFSAYAEAAGIPVKKHNRKNWHDVVNTIGPHDQFYLSQPSAIDGNVWPDYDEFVSNLYYAQPDAKLMLDLTYVGNVAKPFKIKADYPNIPTVFFSLSKPIGAYYHRIGGCLSRHEYPGLFGNKWFKNLLSLRLGTEMMKKFGVHELPEKYTELGQKPALAHTEKMLGLKLQPSDVYLLGTMIPGTSGQNPSDLERYLTRGSQGEELVRVCLTPTIAKIIDPKINSTVRARPHEGFQP